MSITPNFPDGLGGWIDDLEPVEVSERFLDRSFQAADGSGKHFRPDEHGFDLVVVKHASQLHRMIDGPCGSDADNLQEFDRSVGEAV